MTDRRSRTTAELIELAARRKVIAQDSQKPPEWTIAELRRTYAPAFKSLPFVQRKEGASFGVHPLTFWNDTPGFDHKTDFKRGRFYAEMTIEALADDKCGSRPPEGTFEAIIKDAVARKIKGGKHSRTLPPAVDGFLWKLSKFIAKTPLPNSPEWWRVMTQSSIRRVGLYLRVSTSEQTTENQRRELMAVAERHGGCRASWLGRVGISGAKSRDGRPGLNTLMKAVARREIDMVAAWSVDRLGRSLTDLLGTAPGTAFQRS